MKVSVDQNKCIGCGICLTTAPETFDFNDEGLAYVKNNDCDDAEKDNITNALKSCPTEAISIKK